MNAPPVTTRGPGKGPGGHAAAGLSFPGTFACMLLLAGLTVGVFWRHLFLGYTFPYDFLATSRWAVFLTSTLSTEHFTEWIPFAGGGFPLPYNALSGLYFPVWWVMGALEIPATVTALSVIQAAHVFLGAAGTFALARSLGLERPWALVAACAFIFFGGIYSNGSHDLILRGHSYAPWLLWTMTPPQDKRGWLRIVFLPFWIWLIASGGYSGQAMAFLQVALTYLATHLWLARPRLREFAACLVPALVGAAAVMAAIYYPAAVADRAGELYRPFPPTPLMRSLFALQVRDFWGLYLDPFAWGFAVATVTGWAVGVVVLVGVTCISRSDLRQNVALVVAGAAAFLLAFLPSWLPAGRLMASVPLLFPSRLPASDTKAMVAVALFCLAAMGWKRVASGARPWVLPTIISLLLTVGISTAPRVSEVEPTHYPWAIVLLVLGGAGLAYLGARMPTRVFIAAVLILTIAEGSRVAFEMEFAPGVSPWALPPSLFPERELHDIQARTLREQLDSPPRSRPARVPELDPAFTLQAGQTGDALGHLGAAYYLGDYGGAMTTARRKVAEQPQLRKMMLEPWTASVWPCRQMDCSGRRIGVPDFAGRQSDRVRTTSYGLSKIKYLVSLPEPSLMIENEIFARGWSADRSDIRAISVDGTLRGWILPAGDYQFNASYVLPERKIQQALAALALTAFGGSFATYLLAEKKRRTTVRPAATF